TCASSAPPTSPTVANSWLATLARLLFALAGVSRSAFAGRVLERVEVAAQRFERGGYARDPRFGKAVQLRQQLGELVAERAHPARELAIAVSLGIALAQYGIEALAQLAHTLTFIEHGAAQLLEHRVFGV